MHNPYAQPSSPQQHPTNNNTSTPITSQWYEHTCQLDLQVAKAGYLFRTPTCVGFDGEQEVVYTGWDDGTLTTMTYHAQDGGSLEYYSCVCAHAKSVKQLLPLVGVGVASVSEQRVRIHNRGGSVLFTGAVPAGKTPTPTTKTTVTTNNTLTSCALSDNYLVAGALDHKLYSFDLSQGGRVMPRTLGELGHGINRVAVEWGGGFHHRTSVLCGGTTGELTVFDPRSRMATNSFKAHTGPVVDIATNSDHMVVTAGTIQPPKHALLHQPNLRPKGDTMVKVFDMRMVRQVAPIQCHPQPAIGFLKFLPESSNTLMMVGEVGNVWINNNIIAGDGMQQDDEYHQVQTGGGVITGVAMSSTTDHSMVMCDSMGHTHLWSSSRDGSFRVNTPEATGVYSGGVLDPTLPPAVPIPSMLQHPVHWHYESDLVNQAYIMSDMLTPGVSKDTLLSAFPKTVANRPMRPNKQELRIHPELQEKVQQREFIGYIPNSHHWNGYALLFGSKHHRDAYLDVDPRNTASSPRGGPGSYYNQDPADLSSHHAARRPPVRFRQPKVSHSKLGLESFDFGVHNQTRFAGLEADMPNAFANPILQMLYFILPLRNTLLGFYSDAKDCLATEAGFLFHMLDQAQDLASSKVKSCQARNFLRTFRLSPYAQALGLMEPTKLEIYRRAGALVRFLLEHFCAASPDLKSVTEGIFGTSVVHQSKWEKAKDTSRTSCSLMIDLVYPPKQQQQQSITTFAELLQTSFTQTQRNKLWCDELNSYQPVVQTRQVTNLADVLLVNCAHHDAQQHENILPMWWGKKSNNDGGKNDTNDGGKNDTNDGGKNNTNDGGKNNTNDGGKNDTNTDFLTPYLAISKDKKTVKPIPDRKTLLQAVESWGGNGFDLFELIAVVSHVQDDTNNTNKQQVAPTSPGGVGASTGGSTGGGHLMVHVKIPKAYQGAAGTAGSTGEPATTSEPGKPKNKNPTSGSKPNHKTKSGKSKNKKDLLHDDDDHCWLLFNDFAVSPASLYDEVLDFSQENLRSACVVAFKRLNVHWDVAESVPSPTSISVFHRPSIGQHQNQQHQKPSFVQLPLDAIPGKGDLVAIDCEFVALTTDEFEVKADGSRHLLEQAQLSLARVSCLTGDQTTFIDDYIVTPEPVVDYLTRFSGLVPGDLDPASSTHHLLPLKVVYIKLRQLVDRGCVFVGHGLKKDFRVINVFVPPSQVIDTVNLFYIEGHRKLSLRFLASYLLQSDIQGEIHDSIEDARTALLLYRKYQEFVKAGTLKSKLLEIYEAGRIRNWT